MPYLDDLVEQQGHTEGRNNQETPSVAGFLTLEPTELMIIWANGYIKGWLDWVEATMGETVREATEEYFDTPGPGSVKWTQQDIIREIRIARRDKDWFGRVVTRP